MAVLAFFGAAAAEIAGCLAFRTWLRLDRSPWWIVSGTLSLSDQAGRSYAANGDIYIASAVLWLWPAEGVRPDRWDILGAGLCIVGAAVI